jgi:hypothetical protein
MARAGTANFKLSAQGPVAHDQFWREGLNREQWNHYFHPLHTDVLHPTYKYMNTTSHEEQGKTWNILANTHSHAAKDSSYRPNVMYPSRLLELGTKGREGVLTPGRSEDARSARSGRSGRSVSIGSARSNLHERPFSGRSSLSGRAQVRAVSMGRTVNQPDIPSFQRIMGM